MILNREQFVSHWNNIEPGSWLGNDDSPLWIPEQSYKTKSNWFICLTRPLTPISLEYREWCRKNCAGSVLCYSSSKVEEWWGFSEKNDIMMWLLRWS